MKLSADELQELKEQKPTKVWRLVIPTDVPGRHYSSAGTEYTVLSVDQLVRGDVLRRFGMKGHDELRERFGTWETVWLVVIVYGDRTDSPRLLAPSGSGRDYTDILGRAMPEEPEAVDAQVAARFAKAADADTVQRTTKRRKRQKIRSARNLLRRALDEP